jgi:hypothetical protein
MSDQSTVIDIYTKVFDAANFLLTCRDTGEADDDLEWAVRYLLNAAEERLGTVGAVSAVVLRVMLERHDADVLCEWVHEIKQEDND